MFHHSLLERTVDRKIKNRIYCFLCTALLAAGKVFAEDDIIDYDPDQNFTLFGLLRDAWSYLSSMIA